MLNMSEERKKENDRTVDGFLCTSAYLHLLALPSKCSNVVVVFLHVYKLFFFFLFFFFQICLFLRNAIVQL